MSARANDATVTFRATRWPVTWLANRAVAKDTATIVMIVVAPVAARYVQGMVSDPGGGSKTPVSALTSTCDNSAPMAAPPTRPQTTRTQASARTKDLS